MKQAGAAISMIVMLAMFQFVVRPGQASIDNCDQVNALLAPCLNYLFHGGDVPAPCCSGIKRITELATSTADKQKACGCAKDAATKFPNLNEDNAKTLPDKCKVQMDIPISRTTDCGSIKF